MEVPHSRTHAVRFFEKYVEQHAAQLTQRRVYDLSSGSGYIISLFEKAGAQIFPFDLFPQQNTFTQAQCQFIDLQQPFPIADGAADLVICAETIEHLPNQFFFFKEVSRILSPQGKFILTTPNSSSLRSRLSQFLMESEHYGHPAPNELDAYTRWPNSNDGYFSKLFISGLLRLRTLAALQQLHIQHVYRTPRSSTSVFLLVFYPLIYFFSRKNLRRQLKDDAANKAVYHEIFKLNTSMKVLLSKHLIIEFEKRSLARLKF